MAHAFVKKKKKKYDILWVYLEVLTDLSQLAMQAL